MIPQADIINWQTSQISDLNTQKIIDIFEHYMKDENTQISRAEFEKNLSLKKNNHTFNSDINPLLPPNQAEQYQPGLAYKILHQDFMPKLKGDPWKELQNK